MNAPRFRENALIPSDAGLLEGVLDVPSRPIGVVAFSHGSGSGRHSPRNRFVAMQLAERGVATLLLDLLTPAEDRQHGARFDIDLLSDRLEHTVRFLLAHAATRSLPIGLFGASTGAASALRVAAHNEAVMAVVSRGGRPDLAGPDALARVGAPTLLIVGSEDPVVLELNRAACDALVGCKRELAIVPGATHLFEEPGTLEEAAQLASDWFVDNLAGLRGQKNRA